VLYPQIVFDTNGLLLDLGVERTEMPTNRGGGGRADRECAGGGLEELAPKLASRLAIHGGTSRGVDNVNGGGYCTGGLNATAGNLNDGKGGQITFDYTSPTPSEDSSISTAVSITTSISTGMEPGVVSGGPLLLHHTSAKTTSSSSCNPPETTTTPKPSQQSKRYLSNVPSGAIYPCASTTSGMSSTSEDGGGGDDEYYASRGASVCTALLHALAQIDERIREPPSYTFDVCANPATVAAQQQQQQQQHQQQQRMQQQKMKGDGKSSAKRKGGRLGGIGGAIASKRRSATNEVGRVHIIHRCSYACTASLVLSYSKIVLEEVECQDDNANKLKELHKIDDSEKDGGTTNDNCPRIEESEKHSESKVINEEGTAISEQLEAIGTGASKREAKHVASAKLLRLLFPECSGMVEVKAKAEAARERYAASKALSKQSKKAMGFGTSTKRDKILGTACNSPVIKDGVQFAKPCPTDPPLPNTFKRQLLAFTNTLHKDSNNDCPDSTDSLAKLSLSEVPSPKEQNDNHLLQTHRRCSKDESSIIRQLSRQKQLDEAVDTALQLHRDCDDENRLSCGHITEDDLGRIVLQRAGSEDRASICKLLSKKNGERFHSVSGVGPLSLIGVSPTTSDGTFDCNVEMSGIASLLWGGLSVVLVLSRAVAATGETPLGCAVLMLGFSIGRGRLLRVVEIAHEEHLPRERFVECLEALSEKMKCCLEVINSPNEMNGACTQQGITLSDTDMSNIITMHSKHLNEQEVTDAVSMDGIKSLSDTGIDRHGHSCGKSLNFLQSVKEEECEDDDDEKNDQNHHKRLKLK